MSYSFQPMTASELESSEDNDLLLEGIYDFEVLQSEKGLSNANNNMAKLKLCVWEDSGKTHNIYDFLVFSSKKFNIRKIKHFCEAVGLQKEYESGCIPENLSNLSGKVKIVKESGKQIPSDKLNGKPIGSKYPDRNVVEDYIIADISHKKSLGGFEDSDIPF